MSHVVLGIYSYLKLLFCEKPLLFFIKILIFNWPHSVFGLGAGDGAFMLQKSVALHLGSVHASLYECCYASMQSLFTIKTQLILARVPAEGPSLPLAPSLPSVLSTAVCDLSNLRIHPGCRPRLHRLLGTASGELGGPSSPSPHLPVFLPTPTLIPPPFLCSEGPPRFSACKKPCGFPSLISASVGPGGHSVSLGQSRVSCSLPPVLKEGLFYLPADCLLTRPQA